MGKRGPQAKSLTYQQVMASFSNMMPECLKVIRDAIYAGDMDTVKWVVEHIIGKAKQRTEITGADNGPIKTQVSVYDLLKLPGAADALSDLVQAAASDVTPLVSTNGTKDQN